MKFWKLVCLGAFAAGSMATHINVHAQSISADKESNKVPAALYRLAERVGHVKVVVEVLPALAIPDKAFGRQQAVTGSGNLEQLVTAISAPTALRNALTIPESGIAFVDADVALLNYLEASTLVRAVGAEPKAEFSMDGAFALSQGTFLANQGMTASNVEVAILDTDVFLDHPAFAARGKLARADITKLTFIPTMNGSAVVCGEPVNTNNNPPVLFSYAHGTAVTGIVAAQTSRTLADGRVLQASPSRGARIFAVNISNNEGHADLEIAMCALQWINAQNASGARNIRAINMSFGFTIDLPQGDVTESYRPCDSLPRLHPYQVYVDHLGGVMAGLANKGVAIIAASGNLSNASKMQAPACMTRAVGVSSIWDAPGSYSGFAPYAFPGDCVSNAATRNACYAKRNWMTKVAAAGSRMSAPLGLWSDNGALTFGLTDDYTSPFLPGVVDYFTHGTSFAAPVVTSCVAQLSNQGYDPRDIMTAIARSSGRSLTATGVVNDVTVPLLQCQEALQRLQTGDTGIPANRFALSGAWYEPESAGQGMFLEVNTEVPTNNFVFATWFTYRGAQEPMLRGASDQRWFVLQSNVGFNGNARSVPLTAYRVNGGRFVTPTSSAPTQVEPIGSATLKFNNCYQATLTYDINVDEQPRSRTIKLERLGGSSRCHENDTNQQKLEQMPVHPSERGNNQFAHSGNWYDPPTSGQGLTFEINPFGQLAFGGWFTYTPSPTGSPRTRWFTIQNDNPNRDALTANSPLQLKIYETTGGTFDTSGPFSALSVRNVGTASINFTSCTLATFNYTFGSGAGEFANLSGSIPLQRLQGVSAPSRHCIP